jgi:uncharacterized protein (TIGR02466 family)
MMIIHNLFPTSVGVFNLDSKLTIEELNFVKDQDTKPNQLNTNSVDSYLLQQPELSRIAEFCKNSVREYFQTMYSPKHDVQPYITQSWANYTNKGQGHHKHEHPNSVISGVFYVQAVKDVDRLYFFKSGYQQIKIPAEKYNLHNSDSWWLGVETGQLLLFPSSLSHQVSEVTTTETRISISFNTFLKGHIGDDLDLTRLPLEV